VPESGAHPPLTPEEIEVTEQTTEATEAGTSSESTEDQTGTVLGSDVDAGTDAGPDATHDDAGSDHVDGPSESEGPGSEQLRDRADESTEDRATRLEHEGDIAADYLEELLDIADLDGDIDMDVEGDRAAVSIVGGDLDRLVGRNGEVLDALQELTRLAVLRETGERSRLMLDIGGHRAERRTLLEGIAKDAVEEARTTGQPVTLKPMTPFERKVVHDVIAAAGLLSDSEGVEPKRYVVVRPS
jgi:spoIIIJ-associated protein